MILLTPNLTHSVDFELLNVDPESLNVDFGELSVDFGELIVMTDGFIKPISLGDDGISLPEQTLETGPIRGYIYKFTSHTSKFHPRMGRREIKITPLEQNKTQVTMDNQTMDNQRIILNQPIKSVMDGFNSFTKKVKNADDNNQDFTLATDENGNLSLEPGTRHHYTLCSSRIKCALNNKGEIYVLANGMMKKYGLPLPFEKAQETVKEVMQHFANQVENKKIKNIFLITEEDDGQIIKWEFVPIFE